jgi:hypothetical protein
MNLVGSDGRRRKDAVSGTQLLAAFTVGGALLALWAYLRWPGAAPASLRGAIVRAVIALVLLQVGLAFLRLGLELAPTLAVLVVVATVVPVLTFAFLASLWFMKSCAEQLRGGF